MPGMIIHLAQAETLLKGIEGRYKLSYEWREAFLTGSILPDTKLFGEKHISHFWNTDDAWKLAREPDITRFKKKYHPTAEDPVLLGYLSHLYLDRQYLGEFWPTAVRFYDEEGRPDEGINSISTVKILKSGEMVTMREFFSGSWYYGDYTKMNSYFVEKYDLRVPDWKTVKDFPMDEVDLEDMEGLCAVLSKIEKRCQSGDENRLRVFDLDSLERFVMKTAEDFAAEYLKDPVFDPSAYI